MKLVKEHINEGIIMVQKSAGIVIIWDNKILLCHPTNGSWNNSYSFPKGHLEKNETPLEAAIRETKEEIGVKIDPKDLQKEKHTIEYKDKQGRTYKKVYYYLYYPKHEIIINKSDLQIEEIDWAGFLTKPEAEKKIFWKLKEVLKYIK